jgi:N-ethylmaleimide reductase
MAPMTRSRAIGNVPNDLMAEYYRQRSGAGLIITEGTAPSANGLGYARIPGIYSNEQIAAWKAITTAAQSGGAKIFLQLMHTGRVTHPDNLPAGAETVAPSAKTASGEMWTDTGGMQAMPTPRALETNEVLGVITEFSKAAQNAIEAGFDGVELHGANGYIIEQFINPGTNLRSDRYGGSIENQNRFAIEVAEAVVGAIGAERTGFRLSPFNTFNDMPAFDETVEQYVALAGELGQLKLAYIHILNYESVGADLNLAMKQRFDGSVILNGGLDREKSEAAIAKGLGDIVAFGTKYIANPDLHERLKNDLPLNELDPTTFYSADEKGYTDYAIATK